MKKFVVLLFSVMLMIIVQGCGSSSGNGGGNGLKNEKVENYSVKVVYGEKELKIYSIADIKKMPSSSFELEGKTEQGPSMEYILKDNDIKDYSKVTFIGMYKDSLTMTKEQIDKGTLFDITNHDTIKLAAKDVKKDKWIKDIATIKIEK